MAPTDSASSPAHANFRTIQEEIAFYKQQYGQLESELRDFQESSRELEAELEKDIEASEKREKDLKQKVEGLRYEVDEWKTKYKQSKAEANTAQNALQKEITTLRDTNRTIQLKLRDMEVANDDYERQTRHTTSSLEDVESKYNIALERSVILEEEMKAGEEERESLRIESQRLRDELSDLKIEAEITQEKLRTMESQGTTLQYNKRISSMSDTKSQPPQSPASNKSATTASTNAVSTPSKLKSEASTTPSESTPPSPPFSDASAPMKAEVSAGQSKQLPAQTHPHNDTPRPNPYSTIRRGHTGRPSLAGGAGSTSTPTPNFARRLTTQRSQVPPQNRLPEDRSLYQIRGLIGKMQKLEERVQAAKSKLPAPMITPPRASPRGTTIPSSVTSPRGATIPSSVTIRGSRKRESVRTGSTEESENPATPSRRNTQHGTLNHRPSRISMGTSLQSSTEQSTVRLGLRASRMSTRGSTHENAFAIPSRPESRASRPESRASNTSHQDEQSSTHYSQRPSTLARPPSRAQGLHSETRYPRPSTGGSRAPSHGHRQSISGADAAFRESVNASASRTMRRTTTDKHGIGSAIPASPNFSRTGRRESSMQTKNLMLPPEKRRVGNQDVGETF